MPVHLITREAFPDLFASLEARRNFGSQHFQQAPRSSARDGTRRHRHGQNRSVLFLRRLRRRHLLQERRLGSHCRAQCARDPTRPLRRRSSVETLPQLPAPGPTISPICSGILEVNSPRGNRPITPRPHRLRMRIDRPRSRHPRKHARGPARSRPSIGKATIRYSRHKREHARRCPAAAILLSRVLVEIMETSSKIFTASRG